MTLKLLWLFTVELNDAFLLITVLTWKYRTNLIKKSTCSILYRHYLNLHLQTPSRHFLFFLLHVHRRWHLPVYLHKANIGTPFLMANSISMDTSWLTKSSIESIMLLSSALFEIILLVVKSKMTSHHSNFWYSQFINYRERNTISVAIIFHTTLLNKQEEFLTFLEIIIQKRCFQLIRRSENQHLKSLQHSHGSIISLPLKNIVNFPSALHPKIINPRSYVIFLEISPSQ